MTVRSSFFCNTETAGLLATLHSCCFAKSWEEKDFLSLLRNPGTVAQILEEGESPIGFSLYQVAGDDAEILTVGVLPEERGRSLGQILIRHGEDYLLKNGVQRLILEVSTSNSAALCLYEKCGFKKIGTRKNYYRENGHRFDAILMDKRLS